MKAYKGFNKDMTCRGFQFEEGKEYHEENAKMCETGFHACENPLDCFSYYKPGTSVYHEVEIEAVCEARSSDDSKVCGKTVKIGARLDAKKICSLHFDYVKKHTTEEEQGEKNASFSAQDRSSLAARNYSSLAALDRSSLAAQDGSSLAAQDFSSLAAQDGSSLAAGNYSSLAAQDGSSLAAGNYSSLAAQDFSSLAARNYSSLAALDGSSLAAQDGSSLAALDHSSLAAQDFSSLAARNYSSLAAQDGSSLAAGKNSVISAFNSRAKGGIGTLIVLANRENRDGEHVITDFKAAIVDGESVKADTWYKLENGEFAECTEGAK